MSIVTSIHAYNFHLFISYLDEGVRIIPFHDFREKFNKSNVIYPKEVSHKKALQEIITTGHVLLGVNDSNISAINLNREYKPEIDTNLLDDYKANQLSFDFFQSDLYILEEEEGIVNLNFKNPYKSRVIDTMVPKSFDKLGDPTVSNMISIDKSVLLSIRGFGVSKIDKFDEVSEEETYRTEDAQDVLYFKREQVIVIADGLEGILIFEVGGKEPLRRIPLPLSDFPQEIHRFYNSVLIKGKKGLYLFNLNSNKLNIIQEGRIGAITHYYNYIVYSSRGSINLLTANEGSLSHFKLKDESDLDIKFKQYLRK